MLNRNRKMFGLLVSIMLVIVLMSSFLFSCMNKQRKDTPIENGKELVGFDIELAQAVSKELGMHFHGKEIVWKNKVLELKSRKIDAVWNGMTYTEELAQNKDLIFSQPYMKNEQVLVAKKEDASKFKDIASLKSSDFKIAIENGSAAENEYKKIYGDNEDKKIGLESQSQALTYISNGINTVAMVDALYVESLLSQDNDFSKKLVKIELSDFSASEENYVIGFNVVNEYLKYKIEKALFKLQESGKIKEIATKYGLQERLKEIKDPGEKLEKDFSADSVKRYKQIIKVDKGFFIGYTLYEPMAYLKNK